MRVGRGALAQGVVCMITGYGVDWPMVLVQKKGVCTWWTRKQNRAVKIRTALSTQKSRLVNLGHEQGYARTSRGKRE